MELRALDAAGALISNGISKETTNVVAAAATCASQNDQGFPILRYIYLINQTKSPSKIINKKKSL
jgi:hypothetical protein